MFALVRFYQIDSRKTGCTKNNNQSQKVLKDQNTNKSVTKFIVSLFKLRKIAVC